MPLAPETAALAVLLALAMDRWWGEPPARVHPVVWMGRLLTPLGRWAAPELGAPAQAAWRPWLRGTLGWLGGAVLVLLLAWTAQAALLATLGAWAMLPLAVLLKPLFAWRMLRDEVHAVEVALADSLESGRQRLSWLCSRDVSQLSASEVRETALETLAENLSDSVVAPLFWFVLAGLPGAALYRWANTADAMWGYPGERQGRVWTWAGQWAARVDDVLNWLPARLTGLALMAAGRAPAPAWRRWPAQVRLTPSPNGGWPMGALALGLGVRLGKPGVYTLNAGARAPAPADATQALALAGRVVAVCAWAAAAGGLLAAAVSGWHGPGGAP